MPSDALLELMAEKNFAFPHCHKNACARFTNNERTVFFLATLRPRQSERHRTRLRRRQGQ